MHYNNLYHVPKHSSVSITNVAGHIRGRAALPETDEVVEKLCRKCVQLINTSVRDWKDKGMLVATGGGGGGWLRKSPAMRRAWDHYKEAFQLLELQCSWASGGHVGRAECYPWPKVCLLAISARAALNTRTEDG
jgi:hypothetical protein